MHLSKWILAACLSLLSFNALSCPKPDCIRIGSWNIAWLGNENRKQASDATTIDAMARMIAEEWSIDLISLEEINTDLSTPLYGEKNSLEPWRQLQTALQKRGYQTQSGSSGQAQRIVFAWRKPVTVISRPQDMSIPDSYRVDDYCRSAGLRKPLAGLFRADQFDFWAIGLHLKSGYGGNSACANAVRSLQTYYLEKKLKELEKADRDILLLGDFNASSKHDSLQALREHGFIALTDKVHRDANSNNHSQGKGNRGSIIDHIMILPGSTIEWQEQSTMIFKPIDPGSFSTRYSDHVPVWADFNTSRDDD